MKKFSILFSLLVLILFVSPLILAESSFNYNEAIQKQLTSLEISNKIYSTSSKLETNLSLFPLNDERQSSISITDPVAQPTASGILFYFNKKGNLEFKLFANITTKLLIKPLQNQNLENVRIQAEQSPEIRIYLKPSSFADSNNAIIKSKAQQLVKTNNSVEALYILAEYVKNSMVYDLNSSDLKKASEIILEKRGVCAHYTILFVSLARATGIPARYVSGVAYSTRTDSFEEHAWAEVWLPDQGWVSFDTTFGQYGWIDTNHIALKKSLDAGDTSARYVYVGGYIQPEQLLIEANVTSYQEGINFSNISLELEPYKENVGQGSYVPLKVKVKNNNDYYVMLPIRVSIASEVYGKFQKIILLEPLEEKEFYFTLYFPYQKECKRGCISKIEVLDSFEDRATTEITFSDFYSKISLDKSQEIINSTEPEDFDFYCLPEKETYTKDDEKRVICSVKSAKSENLTLCYQDQCFEKFFEKDKLVSQSINVSQNETSTCLKLSNTNFSLNSCVLFNNKEDNFFEKILNWFRKLVQNL